MLDVRFAANALTWEDLTPQSQSFTPRKGINSSNFSSNSASKSTIASSSLGTRSFGIDDLEEGFEPVPSMLTELVSSGDEICEGWNKNTVSAPLEKSRGWKGGLAGFSASKSESLSVRDKKIPKSASDEMLDQFHGFGDREGEHSMMITDAQNLNDNDFNSSSFKGMGTGSNKITQVSPPPGLKDLEESRSFKSPHLKDLDRSPMIHTNNMSDSKATTSTRWSVSASTATPPGGAGDDQLTISHALSDFPHHASPMDSAPPIRVHRSVSGPIGFGNGKKGKLLLTEVSAPWPTSATILRSPNYSYDNFTEKIDSLIKEYFRSGDYPEFASQFAALRTVVWNDVLTSQIFRLGLDQYASSASLSEQYKTIPSMGFQGGSRDSKESAGDSVGEGLFLGSSETGLRGERHTWEDLLLGLHHDGLLSGSELFRGIYGWIAGLGDLEMDVPYAGLHILRFLDRAVTEGVLSPNVFYRLPENLLQCPVPSAPEDSDAELDNLDKLSANGGSTFILNDLDSNLMNKSGLGMSDSSNEDMNAGFGGFAKVTGWANKEAGVAGHYATPSDQSTTSMTGEGAGLGAGLVSMVVEDVGGDGYEMQIPSQPLLGSPIIMRSRALSNVKFYGQDHKLISHARSVAKEVRAYKRLLTRVISDYYALDPFDRAKSILLEQNPLFGHELVKRLIIASFDAPTQHQARTRGSQAVYFIQKALKTCLINDEDIQLGLANVLGRISDVSIDVPFANKLFENVLVSLVQAEIVSADLVKKEQVLAYGGALGASVLQSVLHKTPEYSRKIWAGTDERCLIKEIQTSIAEYFDSHDCEEVARIVGELHLNRELEIKFIREVLLYSLERKQIPTGLALLTYLDGIYWSSHEIEDAVEAIRIEVDELLPDFPMLNQETSEVVDFAHRCGLVSREFVRMDQDFLV